MIEPLNYDPLKDPSIMFGLKGLYDKINEIIDIINQSEINKIIDAANKSDGGRK